MSPPGAQNASDQSKIDNYFEKIDFDFLEEIMSDESGLVDCYLSDHDYRMLISLPVADKWTDISSSDSPVYFDIDKAKEDQWLIAKKEINYMKKSATKLFAREKEDGSRHDLRTADIIMGSLGPDSSAGKFIQEQLDLDACTYLKWISTFCLQAAYRVSSTELFNNASLLRSHVPFNQIGEYTAIWKQLSKLQELPTHEIRDSRQAEAPWKELETIVNNLLRQVSIEGRKGKISIALDDDKIWFASKVS